MSLPDLALQIIYARIAWGLIAAAMLLSVLPTLLPRIFPRLAQRSKAMVAITIAIMMALPGAGSPAYWLTLIFQYPSGLLAGYSLVALGARWTERPVDFLLHPAFALVLTLVGMVLYLDAFGVLAWGLYYRGFDSAAATLLAVAASAAGAAAVLMRWAVSGGAALLAAVLLFSLLRLPTGNLWDALLDPLLWAWALGSVVVSARRYYYSRSGRSAAAASPELAPAGGIEQI